MDDRYRSSRHQVGSASSIGRSQPALRHDSSLSSGVSGPSHLSHHHGNPQSSTTALRNLSAQLQGMISETNNMRGSVGDSGRRHYASHSSYQEPPARGSYDSSGLISSNGAQSGRPTRSSVAMDRPTSSSPYHHHQQPGITAEDRSASSFQVASLQEQVKLHKQSIDNLIDEKTTLEQSVAKLELVIAEKDGDCTLAVQHIEVTKKQNEDLQAAVTDLERKAHQQTQVIGEKDLDISKLTGAVQKLKQSSDTLAAEKEDISNQLKTQSDAYVHLEGEHQQLKHRLLELEAQAGELTTQRDSTSQYADLFKEKLTQQVSSLSEEIASLNQQVEQKDAASVQLQLQIAELQGTDVERAAATEQRIQQMTSQLAAERQSIQADLTNEMDKNRTMHQQVVKQQDHIKELENQLTHTGNQASTAMRAVRQELEKERSRLQISGQEKDAVRKQLQDLHRDHSRLMTEHQQTLSRLNSEGGDHKELENQLQEKTALLRQLQSELIQHRGSSEAVSRENALLRQQVEATLSAAKHVVASSGNTSSQPVHNGATSEPEEDMSTSQVPMQQAQALQHAVAELQADREHILAEFHRHSQAYQSHIANLRAELTRCQVQAQRGSSADLSLMQTSAGTGTSHAGGASATGDEGVGRPQPVAQADHGLETQCDSCAAARLECQAHKNTLLQIQTRFTEVMTEKADLVQSLEAMEHRLVQLEVETDTIGEYVSVYRSQREELLSQFGEKRKLITWLQSERSQVVGLLHRLNSLARYAAPADTVSNGNGSVARATVVATVAGSTTAPVQNGGGEEDHQDGGPSAADPSSEMMQRLIEVIFYLCQGDPGVARAAAAGATAAGATAAATPATVTNGIEGEEQKVLSTPVRGSSRGSTTGSNTTTGHSAPSSSSFNTPVRPAATPLTNAQGFVAPYSTVKSDVYAI